MEDLDGEVLPALAEEVLLLLLEDLTGPVMRIYDVVSDLELDVLELRDQVEVLELVFDYFGQGVLLVRAGQGRFQRVGGRAVRSAGNDPRD
ncbi:MAG: hypothetical protein ACR2L9_11450 [Solirubrobacteraceae bacterium]